MNSDKFTTKSETCDSYDCVNFIGIIIIFYSLALKKVLKIFVKEDSSIRVSNSLDPDQDQCSIGPDLGSNWLKRLSSKCTLLSVYADHCEIQVLQ